MVIHEAALLAGVEVGPCPFVDEAVVQCSLENILAAGKEQNEELLACQSRFVWWSNGLRAWKEYVRQRRRYQIV